MSKKSKKTEETPLLEETTLIEEPVTEEPDENTPLLEEPVPVETDEQKAVKEFCKLWNGLKNHNIITDEDARTIHKLWQTAAKRTDYYVNCAVCIIQKIKWLKKKAAFYGYECSK